MPMVVTANFFDVIGVPFALGRGFHGSGGAGRARSDHGRDYVSILAATPRRRSGVLGRTLIFNGVPYTVFGVLSGRFPIDRRVRLAPEVYLPLSPDADARTSIRRVRAAVQLVGRLHEGQTVAAEAGGALGGGASDRFSRIKRQELSVTSHLFARRFE